MEDSTWTWQPKTQLQTSTTLFTDIPPSQDHPPRSRNRGSGPCQPSIRRNNKIIEPYWIQIAEGVEGVESGVTGRGATTGGVVYPVLLSEMGHAWTAVLHDLYRCPLTHYPLSIPICGAISLSSSFSHLPGIVSNGPAQIESSHLEVTATPSPSSFSSLATHQPQP